MVPGRRYHPPPAFNKNAKTFGIPRKSAHQKFTRPPIKLHRVNGVCPFHGDCLEGLASGPAIKARWGVSLSELPSEHPGHDMIAWYLAQAAATLQAIFEPAKIILGGGVMETNGLLDRVRVAATQASGKYFTGDPQMLIVAPSLGADAGILGALALAELLVGETTNIDVN